MTANRDADRIVRAWLDLMPSEAPDRAVDAVLQAIESTPQRRPLLGRRPKGLTSMRFSILGAAAVVAIVAGITFFAPRPQAPIGVPTPTATPTPSPTPSATPAPSFAPFPAATALWGDWVADVDLGLPSQGPRIQLSIKWDDGLAAWIQTDYVTGVLVFQSHSVVAPTGQVRFVADDTVDGCHKGDVGTYRWDRSADGLFLTLTTVSDPCADRARAFGRTWVHTLSAVTDGGLGVMPVNNIQATLPHRRFGMSGANGVADLTTFDSVPFIELLAIPAPHGLIQPCSGSGGGSTAALATSADVVAYLRGLPWTVKTAAATIDGRPAVHVVATPIPVPSCPARQVHLFQKLDGSGDDWTVSSATQLSLWVLDRGGQSLVIWYHGATVTPGDEQAVISSIRFIDKLPTPTP